MKKPAWGHLKVVEEGADPVLARGLKGVYQTGEDGPAWMMLECDCGYRFRIYKHEFPGRAALRYCGRANCPTIEQPESRPRGRPPLPINERGQMFSFYLKPSLIECLRLYAEDANISMSAAAAAMLTDGLQLVTDHRQLKKRARSMDNGAARQIDRAHEL